MLIGLLLNRYWKPVYCYLRRHRYDNEQAKDLTQGFFHEVVLGRGLIQKAEKSKGRFRSFLLLSLNRYLINIKHEEATQKRIPRNKLVPLDMIEAIELPQTVAQLKPEDSFNYAWVSSLLEQVLEQVENKCRQDGKTVHWRIFHDRVLEPIMDGTNSPSLQEVCDKYGIQDDAKASNMIVTVKRRFQAALRSAGQPIIPVFIIRNMGKKSIFGLDPEKLDKLLSIGTDDVNVSEAENATSAQKSDAPPH